jgi:Ca2+-binding RTX toxin-like protein
VSTYFFETITSAQALAFNGQVDTLVFSNPRSTGASVRVTFNPASDNGPASLTVWDLSGGRIVVFGTGLEALRSPVFPDGSALGVATPAGSQITDGPLGDGTFGLPGPDTLHGLGGDDVLQGGQGPDVLDGGAGSDQFLFAPLDSPAVAGQMDRIIDWSSDDHLAFAFQGGLVSTPMGSALNYVETTAASFSAALTAANALIAGGNTEYVSVQVGSDVIVFADTNGDHGVAEDAVTLVGRTLADISAQNIIPGAVAPHSNFLPPPPVSPPPVSPPPVSPPPVSPPPVSPPPPPPPPPPPGQGVTETIGGGGDINATQLSNLLNHGVVTASSTLLSLQDGGSGLLLKGAGLTYDAAGDITGGTFTGMDFHLAGGPHVDIEGMSAPADYLTNLLATVSSADVLNAILGGNDVIVGDATANRLIGGDGSDTMTGGGGADVFVISGNNSPLSLGLSGHPERLDHITDWSSDDFLQFTDGPAMAANRYTEIVTATVDSALNFAAGNQLTPGAAPYIAAQVGNDVIVIEGLNAVVLSGRTLADISAANLGPTPPGAAPPPPPAAGATVDLYDGSDMGTFQESSLQGATGTFSSTLEHLSFGGGTAEMFIRGAGLTYNASGILIGGTVSGVEITSPAGHFVLAGAHTDGAVLGQAFQSNDANLSISTLLSGDDVITVRGTTAPATDTSFTGMGYGGNDLLVGGGGMSSLFGGDGNDTVQAGSAAQSYLRGDNGDDSLSGGVGFDDINGNQGNDTVHGNGGDDYSVGGKGDDLLFGDAGDDIVWGNLGNDTCNGGDGNDQVRGGQGDDSLSGGAGNDFISGDRGNDTESGGAGADIFHTSSGAGIDRVLDFNLSEGDRVQLDPGTVFSVSQVGADTVINMGNGDQMILVGVSMSTLTGAWIFGA